ncbi:hypothetical protein MAUB1S_07068 [Mycolicibacterium aubagnense]
MLTKKRWPSGSWLARSTPSRRAGPSKARRMRPKCRVPSRPGIFFQPVSAGITPTSPDFGNALPQGLIRQAQQPGYLLARVAGQRQQCRGSQCRGQYGHESTGHLLARRRCRRLGLPAAFALPLADGGACFERGPLADGALQPPAVVRTGKVGAAGLDCRKQHRLQKVLRFVRSSRRAPGLAKQFDIGSRQQGSLPSRNARSVSVLTHVFIAKPLHAFARHAQRNRARSLSTSPAMKDATTWMRLSWRTLS